MPNIAGAVHDLLVPLKKHGVSMTRFESRPRAPANGSTTSISISKAIRPRPMAAALDELRGLCAFYKVLGTYPVSK